MFCAFGAWKIEKFLCFCSMEYQKIVLFFVVCEIPIIVPLLTQCPPRFPQGEARRIHFQVFVILLLDKVICPWMKKYVVLRCANMAPHPAIVDNAYVRGSYLCISIYCYFASAYIHYLHYFC